MFFSRHIELIFGIVVIAAFCVRAFLILKKARKIDREGIETEGIVSSIGETFDPVTASASYVACVTYTDLNGETFEDPMALTSAPEHEQGQKIRIRHVPGEHGLVRPAEEKE